jgi:hypothetical protein
LNFEDIEFGIKSELQQLILSLEQFLKEYVDSHNEYIKIKILEEKVKAKKQKFEPSSKQFETLD